MQSEKNIWTQTVIKHSEVWITGLKIRKDEENRMKKRTGINYGRKYAAITLAAVTAACTGASAGSAVTVAAAEENKTLVYAGESESTINPLLNNHDELPDLIFSGLMKYDANGKPVEDLAESYTFDKDTNTYTFKLRDGVKWHDGEDFNAEDVVYTYKELTEDETLGAAGYEHYEISNFCKPGMYSRHNTAYWKGIPYLGCGPSAHSFNAETREWNTASLEGYIKSIEEGQRSSETEILDKVTRYNEYIMTSLRTMWGVSLTYTEEAFGTELRQYCTKMAAPYLQSHKLEMQADRLHLTREGIFVSDGIISDLMFIE